MGVVISERLLKELNRLRQEFNLRPVDTYGQEITQKHIKEELSVNIVLPYKTYQGKEYTKEEWEKYEQEQWDLHKKHSKYQSEEDIEEQNQKKELGDKGFFLDEKESDI